MLNINYSLCTGCGVCVEQCPFGAIHMNGDVPEVSDTCVMCSQCIESCPVNAITTEAINQPQINPNDYTGVWVVMELNHQRDQLQKVSLELLSAARKLANILGQEVAAVLPCTRLPQDFRPAIAKVGCDKAFILQNPELESYDTNLFAHVIAELVRAHKPSAMLLPASEYGRDLAPRIAGKLRVGLTADCTALDIDQDKNLVQIRPTYGGNIMASIISPNHRPQMASVRPNVFPVEEVDKPSDPTILQVELAIDPALRKTRFIRTLEKDVVLKDVTEAEVILAGGYGMGSAENFRQLQKLAVYMNVAIGATRKAVDEGWAPFEIQVGQTGKTVAPDLYIACGISGALQHSIGMQHAKHVIAVNNDPAAPIFAMSDVAIMGDAVQVVGHLCELVKKQGKSALLEAVKK